MDVAAAGGDAAGRRLAGADAGGGRCVGVDVGVVCVPLGPVTHMRQEVCVCVCLHRWMDGVPPSFLPLLDRSIVIGPSPSSHPTTTTDNHNR